jgi:repressor LexA
MVYDFIVQSIQELGYPPTLREIGLHMGINSTNGVNDHLKALHKKGYLRKGTLRARALTPIFEQDAVQNTLTIPVLGRVAAGIPIPRIEDAEETLHIDRRMLRTAQSSQIFALRVQGDSMIEDGILENDYLLVHKQDSADSGDIVVAVLEDEVTVKRFYRENNVFRLQPANSRLKPIKISGKEKKELSILGVAVGLVRRF